MLIWSFDASYPKDKNKLWLFWYFREAEMMTLNFDWRKLIYKMDFKSSLMFNHYLSAFFIQGVPWSPNLSCSLLKHFYFQHNTCWIFDKNSTCEIYFNIMKYIFLKVITFIFMLTSGLDIYKPATFVLLLLFNLVKLSPSST